MGNYVRKATFTVAKENGKRVFTPVNRRAHIVAKSLKAKKAITLEQLKGTVGKGSYTFYAYAEDGTLSRIRF